MTTHDKADELIENTVLDQLIGVSPTEFATDYWGRKPLLSRAPGRAHEVLTLGGIDELLSERGLRTPFVRLTKDGVVIPTGKFTSGGGAGAGIGDQVSDTKLVELLLGGTTVVLQGLQRTWRPIGELVSRLSAELAVPVQANAYVTPADARGFDNHYDVHDVFVVQLAGRKHWQVHEPVHTDPLPDQPWTDHRAAVGERATETPLIDVTLEPGDVLYLPRGFVHGAMSEDAISAHLTLGMHPITGYDVAQSAMSLVRNRPDLRTSLPAGLRLDTADAGEGVAAVVKALQEALAALEPADIATALAATMLPQTRPLPLAPLAQALAHENPGPVRLRPGLQTHLTGKTLVTPSQRITVDESELQALQALRSGQTIEDSSAAGQDLVRRLLRLGIVVPR